MVGQNGVGKSGMYHVFSQTHRTPTDEAIWFFDSSDEGLGREHVDWTSPEREDPTHRPAGGIHGWSNDPPRNLECRYRTHKDHRRSSWCGLSFPSSHFPIILIYIQPQLCRATLQNPPPNLHSTQSSTTSSFPAHKRPLHSPKRSPLNAQASVGTQHVKLSLPLKPISRLSHPKTHRRTSHPFWRTR